MNEDTYVWTIGEKEYVIRKNGPGKFATPIDAYLYMLDPDASESDQEYGGNSYHLIRVGPSPAELLYLPELLQPQQPPMLTESEWHYLRDWPGAGVITTEAQSGAFSVDWYDTQIELEAAWQGCIEDCKGEDDEPWSDAQGWDL